MRRTGPGFVPLILNLKEMDGGRAKVGWFETATYPNGMKVAAVAMIQEYGDGRIPPRPFMRPAMMNATKWFQQLEQGAKSVLRGKRTAENVLEIVALGAAGDIAKQITRVHTPILARYTVAKKGFEKPLIDTGYMFQSLTAILEKNGKEVSRTENAASPGQTRK